MAISTIIYIVVLLLCCVAVFVSATGTAPGWAVFVLIGLLALGGLLHGRVISQ